MELEYKIAAIIGSCVNEGQLFTARECILKAGNRLMNDEFVYLCKLADHKEVALRNQMVEFARDTAKIAGEIECAIISIPVNNAAGISVLEPFESDGTPVITDFTDEDLTTENIAKVASTLILK